MNENVVVIGGGPAGIEASRKLRDLGYTPILIESQPALGGKLARVNAVAPAIEAGHVFVPLAEKASWAEDFIEQFTAFPNGAHDDMVDAASQALSRLIFAGGALPPQEPPRERPEERAFNDPGVLFNPYDD